jgi:hypothetical protein
MLQRPFASSAAQLNLYCNIRSRVKTIRTIKTIDCTRAHCPLLGVERTSLGGAAMSANDPKRTSGLLAKSS